MIINLRGNHASGKTTVMRTILAHFNHQPIYGMLGTKAPEAYYVDPNRSSTDRSDPEGGTPGRALKKAPFYVLGPYSGGPTAGCDYVTKRGMDATVALLEKYAQKGSIVFESILMSVRYGAPGLWMEKRLKDVVVVILDVPLEECIRSLRERQSRSDFAGGEKHIRIHQRQFENVQRRLKSLGYRLEYVKRDKAVSTIIGLLK
jgi:hypothetical protein